MRKIWLDTDPGFDDWLTMLMLAANPDLDWLGVSVVAGNAPLDITHGNALKIKAHYGLAVPIYAGCAEPLSGVIETAQSILGVGGMRTSGAPLPDVGTAGEQAHAVDALIDAIRRHPGQITVVAIAPMTNLATALAKAPDIAEQIVEIVMMGGSAGTGNHTAAAEFNIYSDPEAADRVFRAGVPIRMFGLNLCRQLMVSKTEVERIKELGTPRARWLAGYFDGYLQIRSPDRSQPMPVYDPVVALYLRWPDLFEFKQAHVDIELKGEFTRGMTVCEFRASKWAGNAAANVDVAMTVDGARAVQLLMDELTGAVS